MSNPSLPVSSPGCAPGRRGSLSSNEKDSAMEEVSRRVRH